MTKKVIRPRQFQFKHSETDDSEPTLNNVTTGVGPATQIIIETFDEEKLVYPYDEIMLDFNKEPKPFLYNPDTGDEDTEMNSSDHDKYIDARFQHIDYVLNEFKDAAKEIKNDFKEIRNEIKDDFKEIRSDIKEVNNKNEQFRKEVRAEFKKERDESSRETRELKRFLIGIVVGFLAISTATAYYAGQVHGTWINTLSNIFSKTPPPITSPIDQTKPSISDEAAPKNIHNELPKK